jgi:hypothetical protein
MYFSFIPNIEYDKKPIQYPFSESDFVVAKNFFRRYQVNPDVFSYSVYFKKYSVEEGDRLDTIAEAAYGNPFFDWIIVLTNNIINPAFAFPLSQNDLRKVLEEKYENPYANIHHYEIISNQDQISSFGKIIMPEETIVDENFYNSAERYINDTKPDIVFPDVIYDMSSETPNVLSFGNGTSIVQSGTGIGSNGGFNIGTHLTFRGGTTSPRIATFNSVNTTFVNKVELIGIRGDGTNGGETPDISNSEDLRLQYQVGGTQGTWTTIGTIINVDGSNGVTFGGLPSGTRLYTLMLPETAKTTNVYFRLFQPSNSGPTFDHYGIISLKFVTNQEPDYKTYTIVSPDYHIIDGVSWVYVNGIWKRKISKGVQYYDEGIVKEIAGSQISRPVTVFEYEEKENEKKREIFLLRPSYLDAFLSDFRKTNLYGRSSDFINTRLKKTGA